MPSLTPLLNHHDHLLTTQEAAHYLKVTSHTLTVWRCTQRYPLPYVKIGRRVRYRLQDLQKFIEQNYQAS